MTPPDKSMATWVLQAVRDVGFPALVGLALVWMAFADVPANVSSNREGILHLQATLDAHTVVCEAGRQTILEELRASNVRLERLMQQICVNTANSDVSRRGCFP